MISAGCAGLRAPQVGVVVDVAVERGGRRRAPRRRRPSSSWLSGCALASEMMPTLAQRVCPSTTAVGRRPTTARAAAGRRRAIAARSARVLSPSSPISAAALYTNAEWPSAVARTEYVNNGVGPSRDQPARRPGRRGRARDRYERRARPAESRPRTSSRSSAENAWWTLKSTARPASEGSPAAGRETVRGAQPVASRWPTAHRDTGSGPHWSLPARPAVNGSADWSAPPRPWSHGS